MGRPPGSKNKPKVTEHEPAQAGHNSELSDAEKRALFLNALPELEQLLEKKSGIVSDIRNQRKRIVSYGFEPFEIDYALKIRKDEDATMIERRRKEARIARFLNHPIGTQSDIFDEVDRTPAADKAFDDGKIAGASGKACSSPFSPGLDQDQAWIRGWGEGQADLASGFRKLEANVSEDAEEEMA
jgi:ribosome modulation factor